MSFPNFKTYHPHLTGVMLTVSTTLPTSVNNTTLSTVDLVGLMLWLPSSQTESRFCARLPGPTSIFPLSSSFPASRLIPLVVTVANHYKPTNGFLKTTSLMRPAPFIKEEAGPTVLNVALCLSAVIVKLAKHVLFPTSITFTKLKSTVLLAAKKLWWTKFINVDLSAAQLLIHLTSKLIPMVFTTIQLDVSKRTMLSVSLVGVRRTASSFGVFVTHGEPTGVKMGSLESFVESTTLTLRVIANLVCLPTLGLTPSNM